MSEGKRKVEVFTAGCPLCKKVAELVKALACPSCEVTFHDLRGDGEAVSRAHSYGVSAVPAVVVDGRLAECCERPAVSEEALRAAGVGAG